MTKRIVIAGLVLIGRSAGCGKSAEQKQAEEAAEQMQQGAKNMQHGADQMAKSAQQSSDQMAQGLQQMAQGFQQMAQGSAKAVDYEQLKALLPDVDGWTRSDAKGEQLSMPVSYSRAEARYQKDDSRIELEITDTALSQLLLAPMSMFLASGYSERSDDGFKRAAKVGGQPGLEEWNVELQARRSHGASSATGSSCHAKGTMSTSLDPVRQVVESVNFSKLAALQVGAPAMPDRWQPSAGLAGAEGLRAEPVKFSLVATARLRLLPAPRRRRPSDSRPCATAALDAQSRRRVRRHLQPRSRRRPGRGPREAVAAAPDASRAHRALATVLWLDAPVRSAARSPSTTTWAA